MALLFLLGNRSPSGICSPPGGLLVVLRWQFWAGARQTRRVKPLPA
jgi:hypothetical protein